MDWLTIGVILLAVALLSIFHFLTGVGNRPNCQTRANVAKGKQLKNEILWNKSAESEDSGKTE